MEHEDNLLPSKQQFLKNFQCRQDIVIKPADKAFTVGMVTKEDNVHEAERRQSIENC